MPSSSALNIPHSPIAAFGTVILLIAFAVAAYAASAGIIGNVQERRRLVSSAVTSLYAFCALMMVASALIIYAFVTHDFSIKYVTLYSDTSMPIYYKIAAYWGGLDGSLMFWVSVLAVFSTIAVAMNHRRHRDMIGYVVGVIMLIQVFFLALLVYNKNPFATWLTEAPADGKGLNPLLQNYWMVIHPPSLYIGFVAAAIPFAFGIAALASGRLDDRWLRSVRVWTFICWFFLSFGLILGGRWAYEELGWGGYWAWDPVENAGLLPWFTTTAFLHSVIIQEQRGMMKVWNLVLVIVSFFLTIFGTFMTRSGVVQSVHAFGEDNALALIFILFMAAILILSFGLLLFRLPRLRSSGSFESFISREFAFLLNNWILFGCAFFVLFATMFPTLSEAMTGDRITVGPPFFNKVMIPLGLILLFLAGAAPLLAFRKTSRRRLWSQFSVPLAGMALTIALLAVLVPETRQLHEVFTVKFRGARLLPVLLPITLMNFGLVAFTLFSIGQEFWGGMRVRQKQTGGDPVTSLVGVLLAKRRKYGGYLVHAGVAVMFLGFGGKAFEAEEHFTLKPGETYEIRDYRITYDRLEQDDSDSEHVVKVIAHATAERGGEKIADLRPEKRDYRKSDQPTSEVAIHSQLDEDLYLVLNGYQPADKLASFTVFVNPLINWVWFGFGLLTLGTALCLIRQQWVDRLAPPKKSRLGRIGETAAVLLVVSGITFGLTGMARAQAPAEHDVGTSHQAGATAANTNREYDPQYLAPYRGRAIAAVEAEQPGLTQGTPEFERAVDAKLAPIVALSRGLFEDLVCLCGGCTRESLQECRCGNAASERGEVLAVLAAHDLWTPEGRAAARAEAIDHMVAKHEAKRAGDGQLVLMVPPAEGFNRLAVWVPYGAVVVALVMLFALGRRWTRREQVAAGEREAALVDEDESYADVLDDELRDVD